MTHPNLALAHATRPPWTDCVVAGDPASMAWYTATQLPLLAKLPYREGDRHALAGLARSVADAGADAIVAIGSPRGMAINPQSGERVEGWLSGPALRPLALALVADLAAAASVPVIGCGGIASVEDARQFLAAGALAVQIGAALLADPGAAARIGAELTG